VARMTRSGMRERQGCGTGACLCVPHADRRVADLLRRGLSGAKFLFTVCAGHRA